MSVPFRDPRLPDDRMLREDSRLPYDPAHPRRRARAVAVARNRDEERRQTLVGAVLLIALALITAWALTKPRLAMAQNAWNEGAAAAAAAGAAGAAAGLVAGSALSAPTQVFMIPAPVNPPSFPDDIGPNPADAIGPPPPPPNSVEYVPTMVAPGPVYYGAPAYGAPAAVVAPSGPPAPWSTGWYNYCAARYPGFDPQSGTYPVPGGGSQFCR